MGLRCILQRILFLYAKIDYVSVYVVLRMYRRKIEYVRSSFDSNNKCRLHTCKKATSL